MSQQSSNTPVYLDLPIPQVGETTLLAEGIYWIRMPLPFDLNHINLYLLEDVDGWYIVDTGLGGKTTQKYWKNIFSNTLGEKPVKGVIVTHMHPDHSGQAGFLTEYWKVPLYMSRTEYLFTRALSAPPTEASNWPKELHYHRAGFDHDFVQESLQYDNGFEAVVSPITRAYQRLQENQYLTINNRQWRIMIGRGHSPEHVCLYCSELEILISGDHILPAITPNISVFAAEPEGNPLTEYLETLEPFSQLPENTLVLPAHNRPFTGLHSRIAFMHNDHQQKLDVLLSACQEEKTARDLLPLLFKRELKAHQMMFALGECLAHLHYLMATGNMERRESADNIYFYRSTATAEQPLPASESNREPSQI